jgi:hypothetical protein
MAPENSIQLSALGFQLRHQIPEMGYYWQTVIQAVKKSLLRAEGWRLPAVCEKLTLQPDRDIESKEGQRRRDLLQLGGHDA